VGDDGFGSDFGDVLGYVVVLVVDDDGEMFGL